MLEVGYLYLKQIYFINNNIYCSNNLQVAKKVTAFRVLKTIEIKTK